MDIITEQFNTLTVHSNPGTCRPILMKVFHLDGNGTNCAALLPGMLKLLAHPDLVTKKMVYHFISQYANKNPELSLLAVNTLMQECSDSNPHIRGLALKTLSSLNHESFIEYALRGINSGLKDKSVYVRRIAVLSCSRLYQQSVDMYNDGGLINQLYSMLRDSDPIVTVNAVMALEEILCKEGGIVINRNIANHLLNKLKELTPWGMCYIFDILQKYKPKNDDEIFDILSLLDPYLVHNNTAVSTSSLELFLSLIKSMSHLRKQVFVRYIKNFIKVIGCGNSELVFHLLDHLNTFMEEIKEELQPHYQAFFCKESEPVYLKKVKLSILPHLLNAENAKIMLAEVYLNATNLNKEVSFLAVKGMGTILEMDQSQAVLVLQKFKKLLDSEVPHVLSNTFQILKTLDLQNTEGGADIITKIASKHELLKDSDGKLAYLTLLSKYGNLLDESPYIIEEFVENLQEESNVVVKYQLLLTCVRVFFHHPAAMQGILGRMLEICVQQKDKCLQNQAMFYYELLSHDVTYAKSVVGIK